MSKTGRTWKRADKSILETAVNRALCGENILQIANSLGLSYGQVYRAFKRAIKNDSTDHKTESNTGEESQK